MVSGESQGLQVSGVSWRGEVVTGAMQKATFRFHNLAGNPHVDHSPAIRM